MVETIRQLLEDNRAQQETMIMAFVDFLKNWQPEVKPTAAAPVEASVSAVDTVNLRKFTTDRPSKKLQQALDWLKEHPEHINTPSREIADNVGVSHMTVHKAQQIMKGAE